MADNKRIADRLKKLKALAERGVGGEKETAIRLYNELMEKYQIEEAEVLEDLLTVHWFNYSNELEEKLLIRIFYKVTGSSSYHHYIGKISRRKKRGCECTEVEAVEIRLLFDFYKRELKEELEVFMIAFLNGNHIYPDKSARLYHVPTDDEKELSAEEKRRIRKASLMGMGFDINKPQRLIGSWDEEQ